MTTGRVTDKLGRTFDLAVVENTEHPTRQYAGLSTQATYRPHASLDMGGAYTLSRAWGNVDGEIGGGGPDGRRRRSSTPSTSSRRGTTPDGDLSIDQRHRARIWANYRLPWVARLDGQRAADARERRAVRRRVGSGVNAQPYVVNPGYLTPPRWQPDDRTSTRRATRSGPRARSAPTSRPTTPAACPRWGGSSCSASCR